MIETVGQQIRRLRRDIGLTQVEFARDVGLTQYAISRIECGLQVSREQAVRLSRYLGVDMDSLMAGKGVNHAKN